MSSEPEQNDDLKPDDTAADGSVGSDTESLKESQESLDDAAAEVQQDEDVEGSGADDSDKDAQASATDEQSAETEAPDDADAAVQAVDEEPESPKLWYILKVQVNREDSIRDALLRRIKVAGLEDVFGDVVVPTEDVAEFNKSGKRRVVKKKLYPGYIMANLVLNDDTWFLVRETPGVGDFTGSAGKPTPMDPLEVKRIIKVPTDADTEETAVRTAIPFSVGDRVRVKEGYFENFEGDVEAMDEASGRVTVMINIFGRSTPVELEHWQIESV